MRCLTRPNPCSRRRLSALPVLLLAAACCVHAGTLTWPGPPPCSTTLQDCIEGAPDGGVVEIATDGPIDEAVEISGKSLTLRPAAGFTPVFEGSQSFDAIQAFGADAPVTISIEGMTVRGGEFIGAYQRGSGEFSAIIRDNVIEADALAGNLSAIEIGTFGSNATGTTGFFIYNNRIRLGFLGIDDIAAIRVDDLPGDTFGFVLANTVTVGGPASALGAIEIHNAAGAADFEVSYNRIEAQGYNRGIYLDQDGTGAMTARVFNNLVTGTVAITGPQPGAISLRAAAGSLAANVLSNTLAGNDTGFIASVGAGASLTGVLANTIVANNANHGVVIGSAAAHFSNEHNLVFGNGPDDFTAGPGTILADPLFVGAGDFHPQRGSPVRDAGNTAFAEDIVYDLDGSPRVMGAEIDIGAWELADLIFADGFDV